MKFINVYRWLTLGGYFGLLVLLALWITWLAPPQKIPIAIMILIAIGPLLFPLRGILHGRPYTHAWTSFLILFYFIHGVIEAYANASQRWLAALEILFAASTYIGALLYARYKGRELRQRQASEV